MKLWVLTIDDEDGDGQFAAVFKSLKKANVWMAEDWENGGPPGEFPDDFWVKSQDSWSWRTTNKETALQSQRKYNDYQTYRLFEVETNPKYAG